MATLPSVQIGTTGYTGVIMSIQYLLRYKLGYDKQKTTGVFDEQLDYNIRDYQRAHSLIEDGIVGPQTWESLLTEGYSEP